MERFNLDFFIKKFEAIPEDKWTTSTFIAEDGKRCALGHCYEDDVVIKPSGTVVFCPQASVLSTIAPRIIPVNDGRDIQEWGAHPKERVLNYLKSLRGSNE